MLTLTSLSLRSSAIRSSTGETAWQGPHHSAQKSTSTVSPLCNTSLSNVASVAFVVISRPFVSSAETGYPISEGKNVALYTSLPDGLDRTASVSAVADGTRPSGPRGGDPRVVGGGADLRQGPSPEPR